MAPPFRDPAPIMHATLINPTILSQVGIASGRPPTLAPGAKPRVTGRGLPKLEAAPTVCLPKLEAPLLHLATLLWLWLLLLHLLLGPVAKSPPRARIPGRRGLLVAPESTPFARRRRFVGGGSPTGAVLGAVPR